MRVRTAVPLIVGAIAACAMAASASIVPAEERTCSSEAAQAATVKSVTDGRGFTLADGREVRLATIEIPAALAAEASAALAARTSGREVELSPLTPATDRYDRLLMRAFVNEGGARQWVERTLVARGFALAAPRSDEPACMAALKAAEREARKAKLGLWSDTHAEAMQAENPAAISGLRGTFAVVEGKVLSIRDTGGTIYVNFGRRWSEDFTVTISKRNERKFASAGIVPKQLEGRRVRVRGIVEERGGPWIELAVPGQIELAGER